MNKMQQQEPSRERYVFGGFVLDVTGRSLARAAEDGTETEVRLTGRPFEVLVDLVRSSDVFVSREELFKRHWKGPQAYDPDRFQQALSAIRRAIGDSFIKVEAGKGLKFVGGQRLLDPQPPTPVPVVEPVKVEPREEELPKPALPPSSSVDVVEPPAPAPAPLPSSPPPRGSARKWALVAAAFGLTVLLATLIYTGRGEVAGQPVKCKVEANSVVALDGMGREVFRYEFADGLHPRGYVENVHAENLCKCADLDGSGINTVLFGQVSNAKSIANAQKLYGFRKDARGKLHVSIFQNGGSTVEGIDTVYAIALILTRDAKSPGKARVFVSSPDSIRSAINQVVALDKDLKVVGEYWHPGHLHFGQVVDWDQDGKDELYIAGVNNGHHAATVLQFDPDNISGTPTAMPDERFLLRKIGPKGSERDIGPGSEKRVIMINRADIITTPFQPQPYCRVREEIKFGADSAMVAVSMNEATTSETVALYYFDRQWKLRSAEPTVTLQHRHQELERLGYLKHQLEVKELEMLVNKTNPPSKTVGW